MPNYFALVLDVSWVEELLLEGMETEIIHFLKKPHQADVYLNCTALENYPLTFELFKDAGISPTLDENIFQKFIDGNIKYPFMLFFTNDSILNRNLESKGYIVFNLESLNILKEKYLNIKSLERYIHKDENIEELKIYIGAENNKRKLVIIEDQYLVNHEKLWNFKHGIGNFIKLLEPEKCILIGVIKPLNEADFKDIISKINSTKIYYITELVLEKITKDIKDDLSHDRFIISDSFFISSGASFKDWFYFDHEQKEEKIKTNGFMTSKSFIFHFDSRERVTHKFNTWSKYQSFQEFLNLNYKPSS